MPEPAATQHSSQAACLASPVRIGVAAFAAALALYLATCSRGVNWQDSGMHQYRILTGMLENPLGLALSHPLHYWLGRAALAVPVGEPALRFNALSALFGAAGVGVLAGLLCLLTQCGAAALLGAAATGLSHAYWQMSCVTETYTLAAFLMTLEWLCLALFLSRRRPAWLVALFACNGLHVADHLLGLLTLAAYAAWLLRAVRRGRVRGITVGLCAAGWIAAASPYWALIGCVAARDHNLSAALASALFGRDYAADVLNTRLSWSLLASTALTAVYNFPSLVPLVAIGGVAAACRRPAAARDATTAAHTPNAARPEPWLPAAARREFALVVLAQTAIVAVFVGRYSIRDQYTFFVPVGALAGLWFGVGGAALLQAVTRRRLVHGLLWINVALAPLAYALFPTVARERGWMRSRMRDLPFRDEYSHFFHPWKAHDASASDFSQTAIGRLGPGDTLLSDLTTGYTLGYTYRVHGGPPGVHIYALERCVSDPLGDPVTQAELLRQARTGRRVYAVPSPTVERLWRGLRFERVDDVLSVAVPDRDTNELETPTSEATRP